MLGKRLVVLTTQSQLRWALIGQLELLTAVKCFLCQEKSSGPVKQDRLFQAAACSYAVPAMPSCRSSQILGKRHGLLRWADTAVPALQSSLLMLPLQAYILYRKRTLATDLST